MKLEIKVYSFSQNVWPVQRLEMQQYFIDTFVSPFLMEDLHYFSKKNKMVLFCHLNEEALVQAVMVSNKCQLRPNILTHLQKDPNGSLIERFPHDE